MAHHDRARPVPFVVAHVEVGVAYAAGEHPDPDLGGARRVELELFDRDGLAGAGEDGGTHGPSLATSQRGHVSRQRRALAYHDAVPRYVPEDSLKSPRFTGPSTFARLPYIRTLEDVDLAVVGVPFDTGVTYRVGGRFGPNGVRAASVMLRPYNANLDIKPFDILSCVDFGDVAIVPGYIDRSYAAIEAEVGPIVDAGVVPLLIGGDHACTLPHLRATRRRGPVAVVDFDSHTDAWDSYFGEKYNHGTWMRRAIEEGLVDVAHSIEVGLRGPLYDRDDWTGLRSELGLDYLTTEDVLRIGPEATAAAIRTRVADRPAFISFDIDVVDPAFAPGTGTPEPGGLSSHDALAIVRLLTGIDFVGFDVVEVIPAYDPAGQTAFLAANLAYEMLSLVAVRRAAGDRSG
jgi:agmatinase